MLETLPTGILNGAIPGGLVLGLLGILYCIWLSKEFRNRESEPEPVWAVVRVCLAIIGIFIAIGAIGTGSVGWECTEAGQDHAPNIVKPDCFSRLGRLFESLSAFADEHLPKSH